MKVLAGTNHGVFSLDGEEPRAVFDGPNVRDLFSAGRRLYAGTGAGLYASDDDGDTWALAGLADHEVWQIRGVGDDVVYVGTQPAGLFRSDDGGENWSEIEAFAKLPEAAEWCVPLDPPQPGRARALVVDRNDPNRIWVGVEVGGIARTTDGGESWTFDRPGGNPDLHMMFAHPAEDGVLFASTGYGRPDHIAEEIEGNAGVFRSEDYGESWEYAWAGITPRYSRPMCLDDRAPFALTVASAPNAFSNHTEEGGAQAMLYRSEDKGESWRSLGDDSHSPSLSNFHGLTTDPEVAGGVLVGTDTGEVWRVSNNARWEQVSCGLPSVLSLLAL